MKVLRLLLWVVIAQFLLVTDLASSNLPRELNEVERMWLQEAVKIQAIAKKEGKSSLLTFTDSKGERTSPASVRFLKDGKKKSCQFLVNEFNNPFMVLVFRDSNPDDKALLMLAILAHELGHCDQFYRLSKQIKLKDGNKNEGYADVYALALMAQLHPDRYDAVVALFVHLRTNLNTVKQDGITIYPANPIYDTMVFVNQAAKIKKLAKKYKPEDVTRHIVYGTELPR